MKTLKQLIKKNLKISFYLKKHTLNPFESYEGVYYILKRKGVKRFSPNLIDEFKRELYNWDYWNALINNSNDSAYKREEDAHFDKNIAYNHKKDETLKLKSRQEYAIKWCQGKILDLGCFDGKFLSKLKSDGYICYGVDFNDRYLDISRNNFTHAGGNAENIKKGLFQKIPFEDNSFDTVISQETLEHFFLPNIMLKEIKRVLKPGGKFIGSTPFENRIDAASHIIFYTEHGMHHLLSESFKVKELILSKSRLSDKNNNLLLWVAEKG